LLGAHEASQVAVQIVDGADRRANVEHQGLLARPVAEIGIERGNEFILAREKGLLEFLEVGAALI
jgi:hypothetical protein